MFEQDTRCFFTPDRCTVPHVLEVGKEVNYVADFFDSVGSRYAYLLSTFYNVNILQLLVFKK